MSAQATLNPVIVIVSGGVVQDVLNVPTDRDVEIHDYDIEGGEGPFDTDAEGCEYTRLIWSAAERSQWEGGGA